ncbi:MAG: glycosyltransferase family 4 protein [Gammaproteobacteria bacterium]|nr:glycosyltransferase family 4 protein [Gammaproteobacteria bacterium]
MTDGTTVPAPGRRLLFVVTEDWYFRTHRLALAEAAVKAGYEVHVATRSRQYAAHIKAAGISLIDVDIPRRLRQPWRDLQALMALCRIYRKVRPDIVHHVALKPVLLGTIAARFCGVPAIINAYAGLGHMFIGNGGGRRLLRRAAVVLLRITLRGDRTFSIVQTEDDARTLLAHKLADREHLRLIPGAGVDVDACRHAPRPADVPIVLLAARINRNKGVMDFAAAAGLLRARGVTARFAICGSPDSGNPTVLTADEIARLVSDGIEYWGYREDMAETLASATLVVLPTHGGEGIPKILLEAGAARRAVIASDVSGCRDVIIDENHGLLVAPRSPAALADAIGLLLADGARRDTLAANLQARVAQLFSQQHVDALTLALYRECLEPVEAPAP